MSDLAIFHNGRFVTDAPADLDLAYQKLAEVGKGRGGYEVLRRCPNHPTLYSIVDCMVCNPLGEDA